MSNKVQICFRIPTQLHAQLRRVAERRRTDVTSVVVETLERGLARDSAPRESPEQALTPDLVRRVLESLIFTERSFQEFLDSQNKGLAEKFQAEARREAFKLLRKGASDA